MAFSLTSLTPKRIVLAGDPRTEEYQAGAAVTPGHLIDVASTGKVVVHPTAGGSAEKMFACEDALQGNSITTAYALNDVVNCAVCKSGDVVYAWLAGGQTATKASFLTSNGNGELKVASGSDIRVAKALEAVDASDSAAVPERIRVRIL